MNSGWADTTRDHSKDSATDNKTRGDLLKRISYLESELSRRDGQLEELELATHLELQKFAELGRLSANLIHEIANPLSAASLSLEAIGDYDNPFIKRALQNLRHLERYMQAARQQIQQQSTSITFNVFYEFQRIKLVIDPVEAASNTKVVYDVERNCMLLGDPIKFNQIVSNLVMNAIDSYDQMISANASKRVVITVISRSDGVELAVKDWGCGISDEQLEHIFEPFYSTKRHRQNRGLGMGLAMVKQIVEEDFMGSINVESTPLNGTTFTIHFPINE